jgi:hypothetical protein
LSTDKTSVWPALNIFIVITHPSAIVLTDHCFFHLAHRCNLGSDPRGDRHHSQHTQAVIDSIKEAHIATKCVSIAAFFSTLIATHPSFFPTDNATIETQFSAFRSTFRQSDCPSHATFVATNFKSDLANITPNCATQPTSQPSTQPASMPTRSPS